VTGAFASDTTGRAVRPRVSVAMATYNGARFLDEQLRSIADQSLKPAELVISDDGSTDDTLAVIAAFARTAPFPVRVLDKTERLGFADNFLFAVEHCRHEYVAMSDQDDAWLPTKLEVAVERMEADNSLLSLHRLMVTDVALTPRGVFDQDIRGDALFEPLTLDPYITGWGNTMVLRRELAHLIPRARRPRQFERSIPLSHDTWLYVLAAALGRVSHIAEPLLLYRQHGANVYGTRPSSRLDRLRTINTFWTVPVGVYRERVLFNEVLVPLLREAGRTDHPLAGSAAEAAQAIELRTNLLRRRLEVHQGTSLFRRLEAFRLMLGESRSRRGIGPSKASLAKDFALGVTGLGRHRDPGPVAPE